MAKVIREVEVLRRLHIWLRREMAKAIREVEVLCRLHI
jgi:hypothetical protein